MNGATRRVLYVFLTLIGATLLIGSTSFGIALSTKPALQSPTPPMAPAQPAATQRLVTHAFQEGIIIGEDGAIATLNIEDVPQGAVVAGVDLKVSIEGNTGLPIDAFVAAPETNAVRVALNADMQSVQAPSGSKTADSDSGDITLNRTQDTFHGLDGADVAGAWTVQLNPQSTDLAGQSASVSMVISYDATVDLPELRGDDGSAQPGVQSLPAPVWEMESESAPDHDVKAPGETGDESLQTTQTILYEGFEGAFPSNGWTLYDLSDDGYQRYWDDDDYKPFGGSWSAWPANGGADGLDPYYYYYPNNMNTWMVYGPFDLSDANDAETIFYLWREIEVSYDYAFFGVSGNGTNFYGYYWDGYADWTQITVGMADWVGDSTVWVGWKFYSDASVLDDGPFVDNISVTKDVTFCGPYTAAADRTIPDDGSWLELPLSDPNAPANGTVDQAYVKYRLDHPDPDQLEVRLTKANSDVSETLWDQGTALQGTTLGNALGLTAFEGESAEGEWRLIVRDLVPGDQGEVTAASMRAYYAPQGPIVEIESGSIGRAGSLSRPDATATAATDDQQPVDIAQGDAQPNNWQVIDAETFEGMFPTSGWELLDGSDDGCEFLWDDDDYRPYAGSWAGWPADGGANGLDPATSKYPPYMNSWMIYGPFDLSNATQADTLFKMWRQIETNYDSIFFGVSSDGNNFNGIFWDGSSDWTSYDVNYDGYTGDSTVWVAWVFQSDYIVNYEGPWIDSIEIRKNVETQQQPDITVDPTSFSVSMPPGQNETRTMTIGNVGNGPLNFNIAITGAGVAGQPLSFREEKVEAGLRQEIAAAPDGQGDVLVYLTEQADLSHAYTISDWNERGQYVYETLWNTARRSQASLTRLLDTQIQSGDAASYESYYIVNAILVHGGLNTINELAARPDVAYIEAVENYAIPDPVIEPETDSQVDGVEWGIDKIRANDVWSDFNNRGEGVVVANIDTGVLRSHAALSSQYRGTTTGSHDYNWFDPTGTYPSAPNDNNGHGTHTMGTMVGDDGGSNQIGVAPDAQWIAAKGCASSSCSGSDLLAAAEWVLAPFPIGGSPGNGDASKRPNIVNNSWGSNNGSDTWYQASVNAWRAAGIFPAFSAGNNGAAGSGSVGSPGSYAESFASGATDSGDVIASFSARGPSPVTGETKPDVTAPGKSIRSSVEDGGYATYNGTSMASPHTAGCAALILAEAPGTSVEAVENILTSTTADLGASGPDYTYGYGRIDCYNAVAAAGSGITWLSVAPNSGSVSAGGSQQITLTFDSTDLAAGTYNANIVISSNDPDENPVTVPVTLVVQNGSVLTIPSNIPGTVGAPVDVPIILTGNGFNLASAIFSVNYTQACLIFDPSDGNNDGIPDDIIFSVPSQFSRSVSFNASDTDGELDFAIVDSSVPFSTLPDGVLVTMRFTVRSTQACQPGYGSTIIVPVEFSNDPAPSFGDTNGNAVDGIPVDGSVKIQSGLLGDCNGNGVVGSSDITAAILEIYDGDGDLAEDTPGGTFPGNPVGCDANQNTRIEAGDITSIILIISGNNNNAVAGVRPGVAPELGEPEIAIPDNIPVMPGDQVVVPVNLTTNGADIVGIDFIINYDETLLTFDPTDSDSNGVPDAITFNLPTGTIASVTFDANETDGELSLVFNPPIAPPPFPQFTDGTIATITFTASDTPTRDTEAAVDFVTLSFSDSQGGELPGVADHGSVLITDNPPDPTATATPQPTVTSTPAPKGSSPDYLTYLPIVQR